MIIKKVQTQYGSINFVEVAGIDMSKDKTYSVRFDPPYGSYSKYVGEDSRITNILNKKANDTAFDDFEKENVGYFYSSVFRIPLEEFNQDWHIVNKDFKPEDKYLTTMKKLKQCPITIDNVSFMQWFVKIHPYLNDEWKERNTEYVAMMEKRMLINNERMLEAFKNQDMKEIRIAVKLAADINFEQEEKSALHYTIENQNKDLMKYLINKKVKVPQGLAVSEDNQVHELFTNYLKIHDKKLKLKM